MVEAGRGQASCGGLVLMPRLLPTLTDGTPFYSFRAVLDDREYAFAFRWNNRTQTWVFDLATTDGVELLTGRRVLLGNDLLRYCVAPQRPPGVLAAVARDDHLVAPGLTDLGARVQLLYFRKDEFVEGTFD